MFAETGLVLAAFGGGIFGPRAFNKDNGMPIGLPGVEITGTALIALNLFPKG